MKRFLCLFLFLFAFPAQGQNTNLMQDISLNVSRKFILPAYEKLAIEARAQADLWQKTCERDVLQAAYHKTADAWSTVQYINFGPITSLLRRDRLYHWPERRNAVSKSLSKLMAQKNSDTLRAKIFKQKSIAVQGFPALERLLYGQSPLGGWPCKIGQTISHNIAQIAQGNVSDWHKVIALVKKAKKHPVYFDSMDEISVRLFTELLAGFQMISDQKLALPMGGSLDKAKGRRAEAWRSGRSTRIIQDNVRGLCAMARSFMVFLPEKEKQKLENQLALFELEAQGLPLSIQEAVKNEKERAILYKFLKVNRATRDMIVQKFTKYLHLTVGFNSLDGD